MSERSAVIQRGLVARRLQLFEEVESDELASTIGHAFAGLAKELRTLRQVRHENDLLREALTDCVEACGEFLAPVLSDEREDADGPDHLRARLALTTARRLLDDLSRSVTTT